MSSEIKKMLDAANPFAHKDDDHRLSRFDNSKEKLLVDLRAVVADAQELMSEATNASAEAYASLRGRIEGKVRDVTTQVGRVRSTVGDSAKRANASAQEYVKDNPWKTAGIVTAVAVILGFTLGRWQPPADGAGRER
jgi:ElaB/YqjD/DUF883 family membrane-anchored ribosome-binding protein